MASTSVTARRFPFGSLDCCIRICPQTQLSVTLLLYSWFLVFLMNFIFTLTSSHHPSQRPMYKGLEAREGQSFSLTSPSHFQSLILTRPLVERLCNKPHDYDPSVRTSSELTYMVMSALGLHTSSSPSRRAWIMMLFRASCVSGR